MLQVIALKLCLGSGWAGVVAGVGAMLQVIALKLCLWRGWAGCCGGSGCNMRLLKNRIRRLDPSQPALRTAFVSA